VTGRFPIPTANANPVALVAGSDGGLWIAEHSASALAHMSLDGGFARPRRLRSSPDAMALGPDGALW